MAIDKFPIEAGHIMMFARAVGDPNKIYYDEAYARTTEVRSIIAPPTFVQASAQFDPDYRLRPKIGQPWFGSGKEPSGVPQGSGGGGTGLHAEQHYEYHGEIRPGDVLTPTVKPGQTCESITEYRNQHGELLVTARGVGVRTERPVEQS